MDEFLVPSIRNLGISCETGTLFQLTRMLTQNVICKTSTNQAK